MMSYKEYDAYCGSLPAATRVIQWGGAHVWKVGGKVFAIAGWSKEDKPYITFKCSQMAFEILRDMPGLRPAPYLASRGFTWIQMYDEPGLNDGDLKDHIAQSHSLVVRKLTRKVRAELGLEDWAR